VVIDRHDLGRFLEAQDAVHDRALAELTAGRKQSHWMWFIFPQIAGLGSSWMSCRYAIGSMAEATAYLAHPVLGSRLGMCVQAVLGHSSKGAEAILGPVDALKLWSSLTLFDLVADDDPLFARGLHAFFGGQPDKATIEILMRDHQGRESGPSASGRS